MEKKCDKGSTAELHKERSVRSRSQYFLGKQEKGGGLEDEAA